MKPSPARPGSWPCGRARRSQKRRSRRWPVSPPGLRRAMAKSRPRAPRWRRSLGSATRRRWRSSWRKRSLRARPRCRRRSSPRSPQASPPRRRSSSWSGCRSSRCSIDWEAFSTYSLLKDSEAQEGAMSNPESFPRTLRIGILVFKGFEPIDVWGFVEAFSISRFIGTGYASKPPYPFEVVLIANQNRPDGGGMPAPVKSGNGPRVAPDYFRDEALEKQIDLLMIPGGMGTRVLLSDDRPEERRALL